MLGIEELIPIVEAVQMRLEKEMISANEAENLSSTTEKWGYRYEYEECRASCFEEGEPDSLDDYTLDSLIDVLKSKIKSAIFRANASGELNERLIFWGCYDLTDEYEESSCSQKEGMKIAVIGGSCVSKTRIMEIAEECGYSPDQIEIYSDYKKLKRMNYEKFWKSGIYKAVFCGPVPHSTSGKQNASSCIENLTEKMGIRVRKLSINGHLKITEATLRQAFALAG